MKKSARRLIVCLILNAVKVTAGVLAGWMLALIIVPMAMDARGYSAIGGEWGLILAVGGLVFYLADYLIEERPRPRRKKVYHERIKVLPVQPDSKRPGKR